MKVLNGIRVADLSRVGADDFGHAPTPPFDPNRPKRDAAY
jgi:hypothetical protein